MQNSGKRNQEGAITHSRKLNSKRETIYPSQLYSLYIFNLYKKKHINFASRLENTNGIYILLIFEIANFKKGLSLYTDPLTK